MAKTDQAETIEYGTFEDLEVYQAARCFRRSMYKVAKALPEYEKYNLANQIRRAALSLTNCMAEGHGRFHYQENMEISYSMWRKVIISFRISTRRKTKRDL